MANRFNEWDLFLDNVRFILEDGCSSGIEIFLDNGRCNETDGPELSVRLTKDTGPAEDECCRGDRLLGSAPFAPDNFRERGIALGIDGLDRDRSDHVEDLCLPQRSSSKPLLCGASSPCAEIILASLLSTTSVSAVCTV